MQLFLRISVAASFLSAVSDRLGFWGKAGETNVSWGNWENFVQYSNTVNSFVPEQIGNILAIVATFAEVVLAILLLIGYKTKIAAICSGVILLFFALAMTLSFGVKVPFDYSVWTGASACLLLSTLTNYSYSLDEYFPKKDKK